MTAHSAREKALTPTDLALLAAIGRAANLVEACRSIGITRDLGMYRLLRLRRALGAPVVETRRGGRTPGGTRLTALGRAVMARSRSSVALGSLRRGGPRIPHGVIVEGVWHRRPARLEPDAGPTLYVGFAAKEGRRVSALIDPEAVLLARRRFPSSARNVLAGVVRRLRPLDHLRTLLEANVGGALIAAVVTPESIRRLRIAPGQRVYLYVKATSVRPLDLRPGRRGP